ncbi:dihydrodipicolinate synthase family protein [Mesorhizobium sp. RP14(2022)]|uniref:Dihydrodipicolinate synthase family protein n=1 Tax=Mesorhizobium liriopis TaxID=2953882 RepID=A0ABT1C6N0_9HYPH|nr:dihydrodipicolinate synthase family protein [Mesorhizobium liriopis]MCO6050493.1 dihydrodipicolinate synthase family protein [Mesorhizobium liriopis]
MPTRKLTGLMPAPPTALDAEGLADRKAMQALVRHMLDNGATGLVPLGGTGEYTALSPKVRVATVEACVEAACGAPVYAGVLAPGLGDAIPAALDFKAAGADGIMLIVPYYAGITQSLLIDYVRAVRDAVDLPILFYDNPARSRFVVKAETIARLAEDRTIIGMKASSTDLYHFDNVLRSVGPEFAALSGWDTLFAQQIAMGACGGVLTTGVLVPGIWPEIQKLAEGGRFREALALQRLMNPLMDALFAEENPGPIRAALRLIGIETGQSPLPVPPASDPLVTRLTDILNGLRSAGTVPLRAA